MSGNWPKDWQVQFRCRPGTFAARMDSRNLEWRRWSARRYSLESGLHALRVLRRRSSGSDWRLERVGHQV